MSITKERKRVRSCRLRNKQLEDILRVVKETIEAGQYEHASHGKITLEEVKHLLIDPIFLGNEPEPEDIEP